ncbi:ABC transporter ATP-binding protein [Chelativorans sp. AA-79]|uniref:ABC transporter ATP-binding protein n=1 Tax=Chelativorans sp. AA-79 TaxID=3028735 RepID=UPI0023F8749E|nr:ABC transporter ATP-binding protein [Chelativorans sp. AA-79]WEX11690.1 ABC transporter ATP-binding protein [Chelativorans sp. AA-79]
MPLLSIENVSKKFGKHQALSEISLKVEPGEFVSLLGPSGCGKTTLLRLIAGFLTCDAGTIRIDGEDITGLPPHRRPLNTVFQNYALFPHLNVLDNVAYGPRRTGASRNESRNRAHEALGLVGLSEFSGRYPRQMSGGQQQRVALARAIVNRPKLLLLDEPLSALDLQLRKRMQIELKQIQEKIGVAFVFVTHDQEEAMAMSDRIAVMRQGRIEQLGDGDEIYRHPSTRFVAEFIGEANLLPIIKDGGDVRISEADNQGRSCIAVVRPEHVHLSVDAGGRQDGHLQLPGQIETINSIGGATNIYVKALGHSIMARRLGLAREGLSEGQPVQVNIRQVDIHFIRDKRL